MVLMNSAKRSRYATSTMNQNQGGGAKKSGLPYIVGREWHTSLRFNAKQNNHGPSMSLINAQMTLFPNVKPSRPIGSTGHFVRYWNIPGTSPGH